MNKENCTKVPVRVEPFLGKGGGLSVCVTTASEKNIVATIHKDRSGHWSDGMDAANAELIAEAFNVLNETGMTPRELANALSYLSGKVGSLVDVMPDEDDKRSDDEVLNDLATCRHIIDDIQAKLETFNTL